MKKIVWILIIAAIVAGAALIAGCATDQPVINIDQETGREILEVLRDDVLWMGAYGFATARPEYLAEMQAVCAVIEDGTAETLQQLIQDKLVQHADLLASRPALKTRIAGMAERYGLLIDFDTGTVVQSDVLTEERFVALTTTLCDAVRAAANDITH